MDTARSLAAEIVEEQGAGEAIRFIVGRMAAAKTWREFRRGLLLIGAILWQVVA